MFLYRTFLLSVMQRATFYVQTDCAFFYFVEIS